ncbi:MAG: LapA family protein [Gammaproteobacteria bacterium]|nr:LapA family protein [Gammaproteobacteria bacterium]NNM21372.1 LapA family protein [Gammaproteobacteria bacterium]
MRVKIAIAAVLLVLVSLFAVQNSQVVEIRLLMWTVEISRALLIYLMLVIGIVIGWFMRAIWRLSRNARQQ